MFDTYTCMYVIMKKCYKEWCGMCDRERNQLSRVLRCGILPLIMSMGSSVICVLHASHPSVVTLAAHMAQIELLLQLVVLQTCGRKGDR